MLPFESLNAATAVGAGDVLDLEDVAVQFSLQLIGTINGNAGAWNFAFGLEVSLDGSNFVSLPLAYADHAVLNIAGSGSTPVQVNSLYSTPWQVYEDANMVAWAAPPARYLRAAIYTPVNLSSFSMSAWVAALVPGT